ncbi:unnamed protein product [Lota lota]
MGTLGVGVLKVIDRHQQTLLYLESQGLGVTTSAQLYASRLFRPTCYAPEVGGTFQTKLLTDAFDFRKLSMSRIFLWDLMAS